MSSRPSVTAADTRMEPTSFVATLERVRRVYPPAGDRAPWVLATADVVSPERHPRLVTLVGGHALYRVHERVGEVMELAGEWIEHERYGRQFHVRSARPMAPTTAAGVVRWLAGQPGLGEVTARRVVEALGPDALARLAADPELADSVPGLGARQRDALRAAAAAYRRDEGVAEVLSWLYAHGVVERSAEAVVERFGAERAVEILSADPYRLTEVDRQGFVAADALAATLGVRADSSERLRAAVLHAMAEALEDGDVWVPKSAPEVTVPADGAAGGRLVRPGGAIERVMRLLRRRTTGPDGRTRPRPHGAVDRADVVAAFASLVEGTARRWWSCRGTWPCARRPKPRRRWRRG